MKPAKVDGVKISEAVARTGMSERQLRLMVEREEIRYRLQVRYIGLHPADVQVLEARGWSGRPVAVAEDQEAPQSVP